MCVCVCVCCVSFNAVVSPHTHTHTHTHTRTPQLERDAVEDYIAQSHLTVARYRLLRESDMHMARIQDMLSGFQQELSGRSEEIQTIRNKVC